MLKPADQEIISLYEYRAACCVGSKLVEVTDVLAIR